VFNLNLLYKVGVDKNLSDAFPIQNGLKQGDALSSLPLNVALDIPSGRSKKTRKVWN
jgi:hypothetical protein